MDVVYTPHQLELLNKLDELQKSRGLSQTKLSELIGISGSTISQLRNKKYPADPQQLFSILENYFGVKESAKLTYSEIEYADTSISSEVYDICLLYTSDAADEL